MDDLPDCTIVFTCQLMILVSACKPTISTCNTNYPFQSKAHKKKNAKVKLFTTLFVFTPLHILWNVVTACHDVVRACVTKSQLEQTTETIEVSFWQACTRRQGSLLISFHPNRPCHYHFISRSNFGNLIVCFVAFLLNIFLKYLNESQTQNYLNKYGAR